VEHPAVAGCARCKERLTSRRWRRSSLPLPDGRSCCLRPQAKICRMVASNDKTPKPDTLSGATVTSGGIPAADRSAAALVTTCTHVLSGRRLADGDRARIVRAVDHRCEFVAASRIDQSRNALQDRRSIFPCQLMTQQGAAFVTAIDPHGNIGLTVADRRDFHWIQVRLRPKTLRLHDQRSSNGTCCGNARSNDTYLGRRWFLGAGIRLHRRLTRHRRAASFGASSAR
jgi:hypothetical protein